MLTVINIKNRFAKEPPHCNPMLDKLNLANLAKLCLIPVVYFALSDYQLVQSYIFGFLTVSIFTEVRKYGVQGMIFKPGEDTVR